MKKSLIALAALAATSAFAQSSVTMYGSVEPTVDLGWRSSLDTVTLTNTFAQNAVVAGTAGLVPAGTLLGQTVTNTNVTNKAGFRVQDGNSQGNGTSRIGWRGTEDLGGGLKANFQLEMGLRVDDGCTTLGTPVSCNNGGNSGNSGGSTFGRNAWAGVSGGFGEVRLGRQVLGSYSVQANSEPTGASLGLYNPNATNFGTAMGGVRFSNAIKYISPNFGGFSANVSLSAPEGAGNTSGVATNALLGVGVNTALINTNTSVRTGFDLALEYANGPVYVGFGYNKRDSNAATNGTTSALSNIPLTALPVGFNNLGGGPITGFTLGGSYNFGVVQPFLSYTRINTDTNGNTSANNGVAGALNSVVSASALGNSVAKAYSVGVRAPVGAATLIASYANYKIGGSTAGAVLTQNATGLTSAAFTSSAFESRQNGFQLGAQYALSKRTLLEVNYGMYRVETNLIATSGTTGLFGNLVGGGAIAPNQNAVASTVQTNSRFKESALNVGMRHQF